MLISLNVKWTVASKIIKSVLQKEAMQETRSGWRSFLCAAAGWRLLEWTAPATASADSVWPLRASTERFVLTLQELSVCVIM